jgi:hypothetical protein
MHLLDCRGGSFPIEGAQKADIELQIVIAERERSRQTAGARTMNHKKGERRSQVSSDTAVAPEMSSAQGLAAVSGRPD